MEEHNTMRSPPTHSKGHPILEVLSVLGQFTRNYTQTVKRTADNKIKAEHQAQESARCSACFVVRGFQRGLPLGTRLCLQSVVCYTLCRRCRENAVAAGEGKGIWSSRKTGLWLRVVEPQAQDWFHQQTGRIWKSPSLVLRRTSGQSIPNLWTRSRKSRRNFFSKLKWAGLSTAAHFCAVYLDRWLAGLALLSSR